MKINEVITEALNTGTGTPNPDPAAAQRAPAKKPGLISRVARGVKGAAQGYQASKQGRAGAQQAQKYAKPYIDRWNQYVGMNPTLKDNPQALQQFASTFAKDRNNQPMFTPEVPTDTSPIGVTNYITGIVSRVLSGGLGGGTGGGQTGKLAQGVTLYNEEPVMLQWRKKIFQVADDGHWHEVQPTMRTTAVDSATEAFLHQQANIATGINEPVGLVTPSAPSTPPAPQAPNWELSENKGRE